MRLAQGQLWFSLRDRAASRVWNPQHENSRSKHLFTRDLVLLWSVGPVHLQ